MYQNTGSIFIHALGPNNEISSDAYIRPKKEEVGERVPIDVELDYFDRDNNEYNDRIHKHISVKRRGDSDSKESNQWIINFGQVLQAEQIIQGDQIGEGGQKGDKIEINRGMPRLSITEDGMSFTQEMIYQCRNCEIPVRKEDKFCEGCGEKLPPPSKRRKIG